MRKSGKRKSTVFSVIILCLFIVYMCALFRITVFRSGFSFEGLCENGNVNLAFFENLLFVAGNDINVFLYYFLGNIVWFFPFGMYFAYRWEKLPVPVIALFGLLTSFLIEAGQFAFGTGVSEVDDLFLNTVGALVGAALIRLLQRLRKKRKSK